MKRLTTTLLLTTLALLVSAQREVTSLNKDWAFRLGDAASMQADFTHGTEYFTYRAKAVGQNKGPASV